MRSPASGAWSRPWRGSSGWRRAATASSPTWGRMAARKCRISTSISLAAAGSAAWYRKPRRREHAALEGRRLRDETPVMATTPQDEARAALAAAGQLPDAEIDLAAVALQF